ncbi:POTRA domain-containing protein [Bradyrhizobium sp. Mp27]|nr:POTRA domain-containing protein [Bradyrhizobium sp. Mp27]MDI2076738.1 POTRA domain-containing protein [Bradyrhizobium sp. Mp27]
MQRQQEMQRQERLPSPGEIRPQQAPAAIPDRGERIIVKGVRFTGKVELLPQAEREQLVASVRGKRLGIKGLYALADQVTAVLQGRGRLLARALLPPQDITNGIVTIEIAEGALKPSRSTAPKACACVRTCCARSSRVVSSRTA